MADHQELAHRRDALGLIFLPPGRAWTKALEPSSNAQMVVYRGIRDSGKQLVLTYWEDAEAKLSQVRDQEVKGFPPEQPVTVLKRRKRVLANLRGLSIRYRFGPDNAASISESVYFKRNGVVYRITVGLPLARQKDLDLLLKHACHGFRWRSATPHAMPKSAPPAPYRIQPTNPSHVLTIIHSDRHDAAFNYLEALPAAALANGGRPAILIVGERLQGPARDFLRKFAPSKLRLIGPPHPELPDARPAQDPWKPGGVVIVSARQLLHAVPAAALASRMKAPLVIAGPGFERRLRILAPGRILAVGKVPISSKTPVERFPDALAVARASGSGDY